VVCYNIIVPREQKEETEMKHYLFEITDSNSDYEGEQFLVSADSKNEAYERAYEYFDVEVLCLGRISDMAAEMSGLDEY
jgi:hypothetical protein